jgi:hypothetical protein
MKRSISAIILVSMAAGVAASVWLALPATASAPTWSTTITVTCSPTPGYTAAASGNLLAKSNKVLTLDGSGPAFEVFCGNPQTHTTTKAPTTATVILSDWDTTTNPITEVCSFAGGSISVGQSVTFTAPPSCAFAGDVTVAVSQPVKG